MVLVDIEVEGIKKKLYIDDKLNRRIDDKVLHTIKKDDDWVWLVDGEERAGKSVLAMQLAKRLDKNFSTDKVVMRPDTFRKAITNANKGDCIVYDEAFTGLSSKRALSEINKILVELMMEMGQKNLFVIIVMPTFFLLERYVALFRAKGLFHVYKKRGKRGYWCYYNKKKKKMLYIMGKKLFSYARPTSSFRGRFLNLYTINELEYRKKKLSSLREKPRITKAETSMLHRDILFAYLHKELKLSSGDISRIYAEHRIVIKQDTICQAIKRLKEEEEKYKEGTALDNKGLESLSGQPDENQALDESIDEDSEEESENIDEL